MKKNLPYFLVFSFLIIGVLFASNYKFTTDVSYVSLSSEVEYSVENNENFDKMMSVLMHQRCMNCHPNDNIPKQGDDRHPHYFGMSRGKVNLGYDATKCTTCHQSQNNDYSGVPGAPDWSLAPEKMKWEGLTRVEVAKSMLNPENNGGRTHDEVMHHLTEHALVLWAWDPGVDANGVPREKPPVPLDEYIKVVKEWFEDGAIIPAD